MDETPTFKKRTPVARTLEAYFRDNPNKLLTAERISKATGLSNSQISSCMKTMRDRMTIVSPGRGLYRYVSEKTDDTHLETRPTKVEFVGYTKSGAMLVRDQDMNLYCCVAVEV